MMQRLREIVDPDDPAVAELARLVRAAGDLDPAPGAQERVRRALVERPQGRARWHKPLLVALVVLVMLPVAIAGVHRIVAPLIAPRAPAEVPVPRMTSRAGAPASGSRRDAAPQAEPPAAMASTPELASSSAGKSAELPARRGPAVAPAAVSAAPGEPAIRREPAVVAIAAEPAVVSAGPREPAAASAAPGEPAAASAAPREPAATPAVVSASPAAVSAAPGEPAIRRAPAAVPPIHREPARSSPAGAPPARRPDLLRGGPRLASRPSARSEPPLGATGDGALVVEALRRLRGRGDVAGALVMLDEYLARFPDGDLAEEALALACEAHAALGDGAASALVELYLARYPHGRFRQNAERARRLPGTR